MPKNLDHRIIAYQQASNQAYQQSRLFRDRGDEWMANTYSSIAAHESATARILLWQEGL